MCYFGGGWMGGWGWGSQTLNQCVKQFSPSCMSSWCPPHHRYWDISALYVQRTCDCTLETNLTTKRPYQTRNCVTYNGPGTLPPTPSPPSPTPGGNHDLEAHGCIKADFGHSGCTLSASHDLYELMRLNCFDVTVRASITSKKKQKRDIFKSHVKTWTCCCHNGCWEKCPMLKLDSGTGLGGGDVTHAVKTAQSPPAPP